MNQIISSELTSLYIVHCGSLCFQQYRFLERIYACDKGMQGVRRGCVASLPLQLAVCCVHVIKEQHRNTKVYYSDI